MTKVSKELIGFWIEYNLVFSDNLVLLENSDLLLMFMYLELMPKINSCYIWVIKQFILLH